MDAVFEIRKRVVTLDLSASRMRDIRFEAKSRG